MPEGIDPEGTATCGPGSERGIDSSPIDARGSRVSVPPRLGWILVVSAAVLVGLALRIHGLTGNTIWVDEADAIRIASMNLSEIPLALAHDTQPPLYYALLHAWIAIFGDGVAAVRSLSVLCGVLLIPAAALLARRVGGARSGMAAAWLMAASPFAVQFSQETRMYMLLPLLATLALERLIVFLHRGDRGALVAHAALMAAAFYTHNWGLLILPASALMVALYPGSRRTGWSLAAGSAVLTYLPWLPVLAQQAGSPAYGWVEKVQTLPAWELPLRSMIIFAWGVGTAGGPVRTVLLGIPGVVVAVAWCVLIGFAVLAAEDRRAAAALLIGMATPLLLASVYSGIVRPVYIAGRHEIMVLPVAIALAACGASVLLRGQSLTILITAWVSMLAFAWFSVASDIQRRTPEKDLADRLAPLLERGDRLVFTGLHRAAMEYYLRRQGAAYEGSSFPPDVASHQGWYDDSLYTPDDPNLVAAARSHCPSAGARTWIVATRTRTAGILIKQIRACARATAPLAHLGYPYYSLILAEPNPQPGIAR